MKSLEELARELERSLPPRRDLWPGLETRLRLRARAIRARTVAAVVAGIVLLAAAPVGLRLSRLIPSPEARAVLARFDDAVSLDLVSGGDRASVLVSLTGVSASGRGCARLDVALPSGCRLRVYGTTESVEIEVAPGMGAIDASSREGDVHVSGDVLARGTFESVTARTATGLLTVEGEVREVTTDTLGGLTQIVAHGLVHGSAKSVSGSISVNCVFREPGFRSWLSVETGTGTIWLWVPEKLEACYIVGLGSRRLATVPGSLDIAPAILASRPLVFVTPAQYVRVEADGAFSVLGPMALTPTNELRSEDESARLLQGRSELRHILLKTNGGTIQMKPWVE